jgi:SHS2 domain-containing protein
MHRSRHSLHLHDAFTGEAVNWSFEVKTVPTTAPSLSPSHEIEDQGFEIRLRVHAGSLGDLLEEAGRAVARLQLRGADATRGSWRSIEISVADRATLLADWLNRLIWLAEAERWVGADFEVDSAEDGRVRARVWGVRLQRAPALLKAATLHGLRVDDVPGGLEGEVTLAL